ncbi:MAG TPA: SGNH/GDSL hydrolase family protein [Methylomirabilota bacterium]|nr:SGNH/GDSL hydrolase family protein [Methylomirabilota bacterium]
MRPNIFLLAFLAVSTALAQNKTNSFEKDILAFEASDKTNPPPKQAVLFIGSSSIRMWKTLAQDFPEYRVINRGFGGSQIADSVRYAHRIVIPYEPRVIVFYAGGNDINSGKSAEIVFDDFKHFVSKVREQLPRTKIVYISVAPNPARWAQMDRVREANRLIRNYAANETGLSFIDVHPHMLGEDGQPQPDIYLPDRLHMNEKGYAIWKRIVGEHLKSLEQTRGAAK